jgi:hypothetical protein
MSEIEQLLAAEREAPPAPAGVRERVAAKIAASRRRDAWRRRAVIASIGFAAVAVVAAIALWPRASEQGGQARAGEVAIGTRGRAQVAAGGEVRWQLAADGGARVEQTRGNVLYTVEHGAPFVVETPAARVTVRGTIFRVEVNPMQATMKRAGLGAMVIGAVLVTVYEGHVLVANEHGETDVVAGERALARNGKAPARLDDGVPSEPVARVAFADDPRGNLRLEGLVLGEDDAPASGATVVVDTRPPREVRTEADGTFALDGLLPRTYVIGAHHGELFAGPVRARLAATSDPVVLRLVRGTTLELTVVDDAQKPLRGAKVTLERRAATTAGDGVARFAGLGPGYYTPTAEAAGFAPATRGFSLAGLAGIVEHRTIALARGAPVTGVVLGPDRKPVAGARVRAVPTSQYQPDAIDADAATDAAGRFRFAALAAGTYRFAATHDELAAGVSAPETVDGKAERTGLAIQLGEAGRITGHVVTGAGAPAAFATVRVGGELDPPERFALRQVTTDEHGEVTTDEHGAFEIAALPRRAIELIATHERGTSAPTKIDLAARPSVTDLRLVLDVDGAIAGVVVDARGAAVADAQVVAEPEDVAAQPETLFLAAPMTAISDAAGGFEIHGLAAGTWRVRATLPGMRFEWLWQRHGTPVAVGRRDARIRIEDAGEVTGRVVLPGDKPAGPFTVALEYTATVPIADPDGRFRLRGVPPGRYRLRVVGAGFALHETAALVVEAGRATELGTIVVSRGRTVRGLVVDGKGAPIAGAEVIASGVLIANGDLEGDSRTRTTTSASDGSFDLVGAPATPFAIAARRGTDVSAARSLAAGSDDLAIKLVIAATGAVEGRVQRAGAPVAALVVTEPEGGGALYTVHSGDDGTYHVDGLPPGRYKLGVTRMGSMEVIGPITKPLATVEVRSGLAARADLTIVARIRVEVDVIAASGRPIKALVTLTPGTAANATPAQLRDGLDTPVVLYEGHRAVVEEVPPGNYTACAHVVPDIAALNEGKVDFDSLPSACTPIVVRPEPSTQHLRVPVPRT